MIISHEDFQCGVWQLCPNSVAVYYGGDAVYFDGALRPIMCLRADETVEILDPSFDPGAHYTSLLSMQFLHFDFGLPLGKRARAVVKAYIEKYGLAPELRRRRELLRKGQLPCPADKRMEKWNSPALVHLWRAS